MLTGVPPAVWEADPRAMATALRVLDEANGQQNNHGGGVTIAGETA